MTSSTEAPSNDGVTPGATTIAGRTQTTPRLGHGEGAERPGATESPKQRGKRHRARYRLYASAFLSVGSVVLLAALVGANRGDVEIDWIVGSTSISLAWIILATSVAGWLAGMAMGIVFRYRTRAPSSRRAR